MHLCGVVWKEVGVWECLKVHGAWHMHLHRVVWKELGVQECLRWVQNVTLVGLSDCLSVWCSVKQTIFFVSMKEGTEHVASCANVYDRLGVPEEWGCFCGWSHQQHHARQALRKLKTGIVHLGLVFKGSVAWTTKNRQLNRTEPQKNRTAVAVQPSEK